MTTPMAAKANPSPNNNEIRASSQASNSSQPNNNNNDDDDNCPNNNYKNNNNKNDNNNCPSNTDNSNSKKVEEFIVSVASKIAAQPLQYSDPDVWAVLTAISQKARQRPQGSNMILTSDEHRVGRLVDDARFQILSNQISGQHCKIYRKRVPTSDVEHSPKSCTSIFLKDTSTNGTYLNWEKLTKTSPESRLHHGDIISFVAPPQHKLAYAFVFREVQKSTSLSDGSPLKRKAAEEFDSGSKRQRGIGLGAFEGPVSLDDFRSLQRSNTELRKQLEDHVTTIDTLRTENRQAIECHETEKKDLKESVSKSYTDQLEELNHELDKSKKDIMEISRISAEQKHAMEDLNLRLGASMQSCTEANEIIESQKASISKLKALLDEERELRREEREKAVLNLKNSVQKVQAEFQEELKRLSDATLKREKEQQEVICKLQESDKERSSLLENLRSKLEDTREKLVISDNKVRQLEAQVCEEKLASASGKKRIEELEHVIKRLMKELEREKSAREEAWAKVSALELEINAAMKDLDFERRKLKAARERIMLRETQLRSFYSTTEEISVLFAKQQEQLKMMQRTLEDEENYDNISVDIETNLNNGNVNRSVIRGKEFGHQNNSTSNVNSGSSVQRLARKQVEISSDEASVTEKHDCDNKCEENAEGTQEAEFTSVDHVVKGGFGSDIDGVGTAPILEGDTVGTEQVIETESPGNDGDRNIDLNKFVGDTMQIDDDTLRREGEGGQIGGESSRQSQSNIPFETRNMMEDSEAGGTIKTADLLASEVAGSWACNTAPSVHGENDSPRSRDDEDCAAVLLMLPDSGGVVAESQSARSSKVTAALSSKDTTPPFSKDSAALSSKVTALRRDHERQALSDMIAIVAPELKEQFCGGVGSDFVQDSEKGIASNSDTEDCSDNEGVDAMNAEGVVASDEETEGNEQSEEAIDLDDEATQEDSVG